MTVRTIRCTDCGKTRVGYRRAEGTTVPVRMECPSCGCDEFVDVVDESGIRDV